MIEIKSVSDKFRPWVNQFLAEQWGSVRMVARGRMFDLTTLPGFVALADGEPVGVLTHEISNGSCEITSLNSSYTGGGVGTALIEAAREMAREFGCWRLWVITTNDNMHALRFYQKRGFVIAAVHADALNASRRLKPEIPLVGQDGIPLRDEIELETRLGALPAHISRLNHAQVTIPKGETADKEARQFYLELLGLPEMEKPDSLKGRGGFWAYLGDQQLHIGTEDGVDRSKTKAHLAYEVPDLSLWRIKFKEAGVTIKESIPIPGYDRFEIRDPFGNRLEFIQPLPDVTKRFSDRVRDYVRYRPDYPPEILPMLVRETGFSSKSVIADIGSGTGKLAALFLDYGNPVYGVEPNDEMRLAAEELLADYDNFTSVKGTAEATGLADNSADVITAGQAFHWFDVPNARIEFQRILKPDGMVVLVWNQWSAELSPFLAEYQELLSAFSLDANRVRHNSEVVDREILNFFGPDGHQIRTFDNRQLFDFEGLKGRLLSSSYSPLPDHPSHKPMLAGLREMFNRYEQAGQVKFLYKTYVYFGGLGK